MRAIKRQKEIMKYMNEHGQGDSNKLAELLNVSTMTIRRDFAKLEEEGLIIVEYGGAVLKTGSLYEHTMIAKQTENIDLKKSIAKYCTSFIKENDSIYLDSGSTVNELAKLIADKNNIKIMTHSLLVVNSLSNSKANLLVSPGSYRPMSMAFMGSLTNQFLQHFTFDKLFLAVEGLSINGVSVPDTEDGVTKKHLIDHSKWVCCMVDSTKIGKDFFYRIDDLSNIDVIVTDSNINEKDEFTLSQYTKVIKI